MLQQTQVKTVIPYWERWMRALPTIADLATAKSETLHKLWEGLGYYTRVRNMQKAAHVIMAEFGGEFPRDYEAILNLPGIGRYTAGAISSIAFNQPQPILDGNVMRVLTRVFGIDENPREKTANERLWKIARQLVESASTQHAARNTQSCSHLNQSLMELGALICTPRQPQCADCPISAHCNARRTRRTEKIPNLAPRIAATQRQFAAFVIENRGKFLVRQRPAGVVNAHLWEFPNLEIFTPPFDPAALAKCEFGTRLKNVRELRPIVHTITRYRIALRVFRAHLQSTIHNPQSVMTWSSPAQLDALALTSAHRKILKNLQT
jgi:A/G-specific adenine glycosylase